MLSLFSWSPAPRMIASLKPLQNSHNDCDMPAAIPRGQTLHAMSMLSCQEQRAYRLFAAHTAFPEAHGFPFWCRARAETEGGAGMLPHLKRATVHIASSPKAIRPRGCRCW